MKKNIIPKLRFPEFKGDWVTKKLSQISSYTKGFAFKSEDFTNCGIRVVRVSDLSVDSVKNDNEMTFLNEKEAEKYDRYRIKKGEILVTTVGSKPTLKESAVGRAIYIDSNEQFLLNQNLLKMEFNQEVSGSFIFRYFNTPSYINFITSIQRGNANQSNITVNDLFSYEVATTCIEEQTKIADFLSTVDEKIRLLKEKHALLQQYKKGVMQKLFSQEIRFKADNGQAFPDWKILTLSKLAKKNKSKNINSLVKDVLTNSAKSGIVPQGDYFTKDIANQGNLDGYTVVQLDDFVYNPRISELAPVGPISRNHVGVGVMSPLYTVFRFNDKDLLDYIEQYFATSKWHRYMHSVANFGARHDRMNIGSDDFYRLPIPVPSKPERDKIVEFIKALEAKVNAVQQQIELTQTFKKGLLQQMFV